MEKEIKEILNIIEGWKNGDYVLAYSFNYDRASKQNDKLLDYITNLQQENKKLKETNVYCNRTDCVGRIKDSRKYDSVYQEKEDYKSRIEKAVEYLKNNCYIGKCINTYEAIDITNVMDILNGDKSE